MRIEVKLMIRNCELLIGYLNSDDRLTDEECDAVSKASRELDLEILLYRLANYNSPFSPSLP
jgi:hypothetical protein